MTNRLSTFKRLLKKNGVDAYLVNKPENVYYLSGLKATEAHILIIQKTQYLIVDSRYFIKAKRLNNFSVKLLNGSISKFLSEFLKDKKVKSLAFEDDFLTFGQVGEIKKRTKIKMVEAGGWIENIRQIKDEKEISIIRKAAKIADRTMAYAKHSITLGMSEVELAKIIECYMRKNEARSESFETIVASGPNAALPHHTSGKRTIKPGDAILIDLGVKYNNYVSDISRTFLMQPVKKPLLDLYSRCLKAQMDALDVVKAGVDSKEVDKVARLYIEEKYPKNFKHNLGHGVGLEVHELPVLGPRRSTKLEENMVITVEPGIYIEGKYGVRIEDMVVITKKGCKILTKSPKRIEEAIIEG